MKSGKSWGRLGMKFETVRVGNVVSFQNGYAFKSKDFIDNGNFKIIKIKELKDGEIKFFSDSAQINTTDENIINKYKVQSGDVLFALTGDPVSRGNPLSWVGRISLYKYSEISLLNQRVCKVVFSDKIDSKYFFYYFRVFDNFFSLASKATGSASQANISTKTIEESDIKLPDMQTQKQIASILSALDDKIEFNNRINENLESQAQALYNKFFSPKSNSTGAVKTLDMYCSIFTGKKNANAAVDNGSYKFFTCSPDALKIDSYIYDGNAIIVSGNGAYTGRTRFYSGKFDLYQRTYACTIFNGLNPDYIYPLYWFVKLELSKKIMGGTRGSAIPYIVMNDLAKFEFVFNEYLFNQYMIIFKNITLAIQQNELENEKLALLRDILLPKLMNGEIDVSKVKI